MIADTLLALVVVGHRVEQKFGEPDDGVERRADFVAHVGQKVGLGLTRLLGLELRALEQFLGALALLNIRAGRQPGDDFATLVQLGHGLDPVPAEHAVVAAQAKLGLVVFALAHRIIPVGQERRQFAHADRRLPAAPSESLKLRPVYSVHR